MILKSLNKLHFLLITISCYYLKNYTPKKYKAVTKHPLDSSISFLNVNKPFGYREIINYDAGFIIVGPNGRMDGVSSLGKIDKYEKMLENINHNSIQTYNQPFIIGEDNGSILIQT